MVPAVNAQWMDRSPHAYHTTSNLEHAAFYSEDVFTAVGKRSTVLWVFRDLDGLQHAVFNKVSDLNYWLTGIHMVSETEALIVSTQGILFHTVNRGLDWEQFELSGSPLRGIYFFDEDNGFIYGDDGLLLHTENGGNDWDEIQSDTGNNWNSASVVNENFAVLVGEAGTIARTDNAGADWQFDVINSDCDLLDLAIYDDTIYALEKGFRNTDTYETTYTIFRALINLESDFEPAYYYTDHTYWSKIVAVSDTHFVIQNDDKLSLCTGIQQIVNANIQESSSELLIESTFVLDTYVGSFVPAPADEGTYLIVGSYGYLGMYDLATESVTIFVVNNFPALLPINNLFFSNMAYTGQDRLLATTYLEDSCQSGREDFIISKKPDDLFWQVEKIFTYYPPKVGTIAINEAGFGFIFTEDGSIEITEDFGQTWSTETFGMPALINDAVWLDDEILFAVGDEGSILIYENGEFTAVEYAGENDLHGIVRLDANTAIAVGASGTALSIDRNHSVEAIDTGIDDDLNSVAKTGTIVVAVGNNGRVLRSTNGGSSWEAHSLGTDADFLSVAFNDSQVGFLAGTEGAVFKTGDSGSTWGEQEVPTTEDLNSVIVVDDQRAYVAGANGAAFFTNSGGQFTSINDDFVSERPGEIILLENYPNPFNPSTTIQFDLPTAGDIRLEVFDLLGRRTALLFNGFKSSGKHSMVFNAGNLSSGMYILRLQSGEQVVTRSMLLLK